MVISFKEPNIKDLKKLTEIMTRAFDDDAKRFLQQPSGGPPGYNDGTFIQKWLFNNRESQGIEVLYQDKTVGLAIFWINPNGYNCLGNIFIDPDYQDKNIGTKLWEKIESMDPNAKKWCLETPGYAVRNHYFYENKCGFKKMGEKKDDNPPGITFIYEKNMNN